MLLIVYFCVFSGFTMILISACLCGVNCKYNNGNNAHSGVMSLLSHYPCMLICPEQLGGLTTPRVPAEIVAERVMTSEGNDVTEAFIAGATETLNIAKLIHAKFAVLKEGSPSCGIHYIYDGHFSHQKMIGQGITTRCLIENGVSVFSENEIDKLILKMT